MNVIAYLCQDKIEVIKHISDEEYESIIKEISHLSIFEKYNKPLNFVKTIKNEILENSNTENVDKQIRLINELMSSFRSFLDYWESFLKKEFGKDSMQVRRFKAATSKEYDTVFAYRFFYELRNYIQHIGFPDATINSYIDENDVVHNSLRFDLTDLLDSGHNWKTVRKDLQIENCETDFLILLPIMVNSINQINNEVLNCLDINSFYFSSREILKYKQYKIEEKILVALKMPENYPSDINGKMSCTDFPFDLVDYFLSVLKK